MFMFNYAVFKATNPVDDVARWPNLYYKINENRDRLIQVNDNTDDICGDLLSFLRMWAVKKLWSFFEPPCISIRLSIQDSGSDNVNVYVVFLSSWSAWWPCDMMAATCAAAEAGSQGDDDGNACHVYDVITGVRISKLRSAASSKFH